MVICFAAGNNAAGRNRGGEIGGEAAAKNCITVGASENKRPEIETKYSDLGPGYSGSGNRLMAEDPNRVAAFSSRGPTTSERIKPDVVAPGTFVLSANSGHVPDPSFPLFGDPKWSYLSGTSQATPLVAGCAAVLREALIKKHGIKAPSAALIKALIINGAVPLPNSLPNESGFGRVNLSNALAIACKIGGAGFEQNTLRFTDQPDISIVIPGPGPATLKVTLVWSDPYGKELQTDLDLIVEASDKTEHHGNRGACTDRSKNFDRSNNVEQVIWVNIPPGKAKVIIKAYKLASPRPPPYACAWYLY
jgi:hypothetical protein